MRHGGAMASRNPRETCVAWKYETSATLWPGRAERRRTTRGNENTTAASRRLSDRRPLLLSLRLTLLQTLQPPCKVLLLYAMPVILFVFIQGAPLSASLAPGLVVSDGSVRYWC